MFKVGDRVIHIKEDIVDNHSYSDEFDIKLGHCYTVSMIDDLQRYIRLKELGNMGQFDIRCFKLAEKQKSISKFAEFIRSIEK